MLFREKDSLGPPAFGQVPAVSCDASGACVPAYPILARANRQDGMNLFHPDLQVAFARSYTVSFQRALSRDMAVDIRYVGTRGVNQWTDENYNEINIIENGFYTEFQLAMANLQANQAAGRGNTFAYFGPNTGTAPLPTYLAYFNGSRDVNNPSVYSGNNWTNSTFVGRLARTRPQPYDAANDLDGNATRRGLAAQAGISRNFFVVNPDVSTDGDNFNLWTSDAFSSYDALQIELRRRLSKGFQISGSYQYALEYGSANLGKHWGRVSDPTANVRHAIKMQWDWNVPVGRGRHFGTDMHPALDLLVGGWGFNGAGRVQARTINFGNVRLVGMDLDELTREYRHRYDPATKIVTMLPDDIILNTRRAFSPDATSATGYGSLRRAGRPVHRAGQQRDVHRDPERRLHATHAPRQGAVVHAVRRQPVEAVRDRQPRELRAALRRPERLRQRQLQPREQPRQRSDDLPGRQRLSRSEQLIRSRRAARSDRLASELVEESRPKAEARPRPRRSVKPGILGSAAFAAGAHPGIPGFA